MEKVKNNFQNRGFEPNLAAKIDEDFSQIAKQYENMIWKVIHSLKIYKNRDDYFQVGLIALWEAYKGFDEEKGLFISFAYSYIRGRILQELNKNAKKDARLVHPDEAFWKLIVDESSQLYMEKEILLSYCFDLTENQQKWVLYTFIDGYSINEIAHIEGVSPSAVKAWRKGAKRKLEKMKPVNG